MPGDAPPATARATPCASRWSPSTPSAPRRRSLEPRPDLVGHHPAAARRPSARTRSTPACAWAGGSPRTRGGSAIEQYVVIVGGVKQVVPVSVSDPVGTQYFTQHPGARRDRQRRRRRLLGQRAQQRAQLAGDLERGGRLRHPGRPASGRGEPIGVRFDAPTAPRRASPGRARSPTNGATITNYYVSLYTGSAPDCTRDRRRCRRPARRPAGRTPDHWTAERRAPTSPASRRTRRTRSPCSPTTARAARPRRRCRSPRAPRRARSPISVPPARSRAATAPGTTGSTASPSASGSTDADQFLYEYIERRRGLGARSDQARQNLLLTNDGSQYGNAVSVAVKACKHYDGGPSSAATTGRRRSPRARR